MVTNSALKSVRQYQQILDPPRKGILWWVVFIGTGVLGGALLGLMGLWIAAAVRADGIRVEPFSVPDNLAKTDIAGEAVAELLVAKIKQAYAIANSAHYAQSLNDGSFDEVKIEIPKTGTTLGEFNRYLRDLLGHETHITGVIYSYQSEKRTKAMHVAATFGRTVCTAPSADDDDPDWDSITEEIAECVLKATQPYLYANYRAKKVQASDYESETNKRDAEVQARKVYEDETASTDELERAWGYAGLGDGIAKSSAWDIRHRNPQKGDSADTESRRDIPIHEAVIRHGIELLKLAADLRPRFAVANADIATYEGELGHDEAAYAAQRTYSQLLAAEKTDDLDQASIAKRRPSTAARLNMEKGDFSSASRAYAGADCYDPDPSCLDEVEALSDTHDITGARRLLAIRQPALQWEPNATTVTQCENKKLTNIERWNLDNVRLEFIIAYAAENWHRVVRLAEKARDAFYDDAGCVWTRNIQFDPELAEAEAQDGNFTSALDLVNQTPEDCYRCMIARGRVYAVRNDLTKSNLWFSRAAASGTELPFAYQAWGEMLLRKGSFNAAIEKFREANRRSRRFADPLEMWGEALIAVSRSDLALIKFAEAGKYAPNWGRLHLKWGEALLYTDRQNDAKKQFAIAADLDLSASDKAILARIWAKK